MKLYEITDSIQSLLDRADEGELADTLAEELDALQLDFAQKAECVVKAIKNFEASAVARKAEADRLRLQSGRDEARAAWLKGYLLAQLDRLGLIKMEAGLFRLRSQLNPPRVVVEGDAADLPEAFRTTRTTHEINRVALLAAARDNLPLPAGVRIERGVRLAIS